MASRTCWNVPQRQMLVIVASISASVGFGLSFRSAATAMIMPDWQYPHCGTSWSSQAFCTLCRIPPLARPSMVVTCLPTAALTGTTQERTAAPSRCTVHEPHSAMPQPYLVPVRPTCSRIAHSRGVPGSTSTSLVLPLIVRRAIASPPPEYCAGNIPHRVPEGKTPSRHGQPPCARLARSAIFLSVPKSEHPDDPALGHLGLGTEERVEPPLHPLSVDAPARLHGDVLHAIDGERARHSCDPGVSLELPEGRTRLGVERAEVPVVGAAEEDEAAAGREDRPPVLVLELVGPDFLAGRHVPRLQLSDVVRALAPAHRGLRPVYTEVKLAGFVGAFHPHQCGAEVLVGRDVEIVRLGVVARRSPVLAAPEPRAEGDRGVRSRLALEIVARAPADGIDLGEDFLDHEGLRVHELDAVRAALEPPEGAVAARMHEALDRPPVLLEIDE